MLSMQSYLQVMIYRLKVLLSHLRYKSGTHKTRAMLRRIATVLALAVTASTGMMAAGAAPDAWACDINNHCYARYADFFNTVNWGIAGSLYINCLYMPNNGDFADNEVWDAQNTSYWVEVGLNSGIDYNGFYDNKNWFWADQRPGSPYFEHDFSNTASAGTYQFVEIVYARGEVWDVYGGPYFLGQSTHNSMGPNNERAGSEYTADSNSGIRDIGSIHALQWIDSNLNFHYWGNGPRNNDSGSNYYIHSSYDANHSTVSWSGPC